MTARAASVEAYRERLFNGTHSTQTNKVWNFILNRQGCTAKEIATELEMESATVSGIVRPMEKAAVIRRTEERYPCPVTGNRVHWIHPADDQLHLF